MTMKNKGALQSEEYANVILWDFSISVPATKKKNLKRHFISIFVL